jgi:starvation-inducible outer membrane lipoprotein
MKKIFIAIPVLMMGLTACETAPKKMAAVKSPAPEQVVSFSEAEVPYIAVTKKKGKVSAVIMNEPAQAKAN